MTDDTRRHETDPPGSSRLLLVDWNENFVRRSSQLIDAALEQGCEAVVLVRSDSPPSEQVVSALVRAASQVDDPALVAGSFVKPHDGGAIVAGQYWWSSTELAWRSAHSYRHPHRRADIATTRAPSCAFCLIPAEAWRKVGPFDSRLPPSLVGIDFALRALRLGRRSYVVETARIVTELEPAAFEEQDLESRLHGNLHLVRKHGVPLGSLGLAWRQLLRIAANEAAKVEPQADTDPSVSALRRRYWYVRNILQALQRKTVRAALSALTATLAVTDDKRKR